MKRLVMALLLGLALSQVAYSDVDSEMRAAYTVWEEAFRENNIETTQAYDAVGLLAALGNMKYFDDTIINGKGPERKLGEVKKWILKEEYRGPEQLAELFSGPALESLKGTKQNLLIVTDFGEETDDEIVALLSSKLISYGFKVHLLFTSPRAPEQIKRYKSWLVETAKNQASFKMASTSSLMDDFNFESFFPKKGVNKVLHIGPVHANQPGGSDLLVNMAKNLMKVSYEFYLLGEYGATVNSKADALPVAALLHQFSKQTHIIDTARGRGAFKFTYEALKTLFGKDHSIIGHVAKIGWRNTVGRANPFPAKFIAHLVATGGKGANYEVVRGLDEIFTAEERTPVRKVTPDIEKAAQDLAEGYLAALQAAPLAFLKLSVEEGGRTNSVAGVTAKQIVEGYKFILLGLYKWFGVPIEFFESGKPEDWKAQWETPSEAEEGQGVPFGQDRL